MMTNTFKLQCEFQPAGDQPKAIDLLTDGLEQGLAYQTLLGVTGSGKTFTLANVIQRLQRPTMIIAPNKTLAAQLYSEFRGFFPSNAVEYFVSYYDYYQPEAYIPSSDTFIDKDASINEQIEQMRLSATKSIMERKDTIIVATVSAIYGLGDPKQYLSMLFHCKIGEPLEQRDMLRRLAELQYTRNDTDFHRGTFRVRGDVIDVFPAESDIEAIRVELFDERVESIHYFDPLTGELLRKSPRVTIYPKTHYATSRDTLLNMIDLVKAELRERLEQLYSINKLVEAQRLEQRTLFDIEMITQLGYCSGIENYSRYLSGRNAGEPPPTLLDYLPADALLCIDESHVTVPQLGAMYKGDRSRKETLVEYGFRLPSALDNRPLQFSEFERIAPQTIYVSATPGPYEKEHSDNIIELVVRPTGLIDPEVEIRPVGTQVDDLLSEIQKRIALNERVLVTTLTKRMSEDLTEYYSDSGIKVRYLHSDIGTVERVEILHDLRLGVFDVLIGINLLREGLDLPEVSLVGIFDADKEGFLRSERSLIQTIGRAARHLNGKVILYADKITPSMAAAIRETDRRREKQREYNRVHNITPIGIKKAVQQILETDENYAMHDLQDKTRFIELNAKYLMKTPQQLAKHIKDLEKTMYDHAKNLEFEQAAKLRDEIRHLKQIAFVE